MKTRPDAYDIGGWAFIAGIVLIIVIALSSCSKTYTVKTDIISTFIFQEDTVCVQGTCPQLKEFYSLRDAESYIEAYNRTEAKVYDCQVLVCNEYYPWIFAVTKYTAVLW